MVTPAGWDNPGSLDVEMKSINGTKFSTYYDIFGIGNSLYNYELHVRQGVMGSLVHINFTTYDANNTLCKLPFNCAVKYGGGFWYDGCGGAGNECTHTYITGSPSDNFKWFNGTASIKLSKVQAVLTLNQTAKI